MLGKPYEQSGLCVLNKVQGQLVEVLPHGVWRETKYMYVCMCVRVYVHRGKLTRWMGSGVCVQGEVNQMDREVRGQVVK